MAAGVGEAEATNRVATIRVGEDMAVAATEAGVIDAGSTYQPVRDVVRNSCLHACVQRNDARNLFCLSHCCSLPDGLLMGLCKQPVFLCGIQMHNLAG